MIKEELTNLAKEIIRDNIYLTLATSDGDPWAAPLFYCVDDKYNFYFMSQIDSLHTKHLLKNPKVAFAIFDSHSEEGKGNGVQASGKAYHLQTEEEIEEGIKWYQTTFFKVTKEGIMASLPYKLFKIVPEHFYILDPEAPVDKRVEVNLR